MLPGSVTGGTCPSDSTYDGVVQEKGSDFRPGGADATRTTAWQLMGQDGSRDSNQLWEACFWTTSIYQGKL